jgi:ribosomal protein S4
VKPGDTITFKEGIHKVLRDNMEQNAGTTSRTGSSGTRRSSPAKINALPTPEDVPFEVNMNLIIEF